VVSGLVCARALKGIKANRNRYVLKLIIFLVGFSTAAESRNKKPFILA